MFPHRARRRRVLAIEELHLDDEEAGSV